MVAPDEPRVRTVPYLPKETWETETLLQMLAKLAKGLGYDAVVVGPAPFFIDTNMGTMIDSDRSRFILLGIRMDGDGSVQGTPDLLASTEKKSLLECIERVASDAAQKTRIKMDELAIKSSNLAAVQKLASGDLSDADLSRTKYGGKSKMNPKQLQQILSELAFFLGFDGIAISSAPCKIDSSEGIGLDRTRSRMVLIGINMDSSGCVNAANVLGDIDSNDILGCLRSIYQEISVKVASRREELDKYTDRLGSLGKMLGKP